MPPTATPTTALALRPADTLGLVFPAHGDRLTAVVARWGGDRAADATEDFLFGTISNKHTREAYARAARDFMAWCARQPVPVLLHQVTPKAVGDYRDTLRAAGRSVPTVKAHLSALRHWFDKLVMAHVVRDNPAQAVRTERFRRTTGATPWMPREDARKLFKAFDHAITAEADEAARLLALRDRALLAVMLFGFGRVSAVTGMKVRDYQQPSTVHAKLRFHEKRGKVHEVPAHTTAIEALDAWLSASGLAAQPDAVLFPASTGGGAPRFTGAGISRQSANEVVKRWCALAGLPADISNHSFRATGLTLHRQAGGDIRRTQELAGHADISTTMLYDHSGDELQRAEVELVRI